MKQLCLEVHKHPLKNLLRSYALRKLDLIAGDANHLSKQNLSTQNLKYWITGLPTGSISSKKITLTMGKSLS